MQKIYINLTNGIEFIDRFDIAGFVRIQSSLCEAKMWDRIIYDLDYTFLIDIAMGFRVGVVDASQKKDTPRAIYQGIPWLNYALGRRWFSCPSVAMVKGHNCAEYFDVCYHKLLTRTKRKLDYVSKYLCCSQVEIFGISFPTLNDGQYNYYSAVLKKERALKNIETGFTIHNNRMPQCPK